MGSRTMPTECPHGKTLDWGDFGSDPDDGTVGADTCRLCQVEQWPGPFVVAGCSDRHVLSTGLPGRAIGRLETARREAGYWNERHQRTFPGSTFRYIVCALVEVPEDMAEPEPDDFERLLRASSIGDSAWVDCPTHGRTARDPFTDKCVECPRFPELAELDLEENLTILDGPSPTTPEMIERGKAYRSDPE